MISNTKPTIKWLSGLTDYGRRKLWRKEHGYDPLMPKGWKAEPKTELHKNWEHVR